MYEYNNIIMLLDSFNDNGKEAIEYQEASEYDPKFDDTNENNAKDNDDDFDWKEYEKINRKTGMYDDIL